MPWIAAAALRPQSHLEHKPSAGNGDSQHQRAIMQKTHLADTGEQRYDKKTC